MLRLMLVSLSFSFSICHADMLTIRHAAPEVENDQRQEYYLAALSLALSKVLPKSDFKLEPSSQKMIRGRVIESVENNELDIAWAMTSISRENRLKAIRVPLLKGLLGYRIFIIRKGDQPRFSKVKSLSDLKQLKPGQAYDWTDTKILKSNDLPVVEGSNYLGLFSMLQCKRFDYFPRGVQEPWSEIIIHKDKNLIVETNLLLRYESPMFFFVNNNNLKLHSLINKGLDLAIADGSFAQLLYSHWITKQIF